ncbi:MAG TPA: TOBE domain-containing protein [Methylomusa anaerophila]|uniref:Molybdenum-pterin-binding protein 2 n=1 Tax=Methylomusa anaerophila TaxID=1930071 RepID=A0A348AMA0_9FIRM|nr:TOBE domain-containing protein [Methylomusa anaerophila]BBB92198.1 molybdenum-pterin-binding protein 2 [Methylomusa anaerophila]HML87788.1 TOBE domain-containing protein [Methylomusa anaerophila]
MEISGRNQIPGMVRRIEFGDVVSKVVIEYEGGEITAIITSDAVRELRLRPGDYVSALVKATDVMIVK